MTSRVSSREAHSHFGELTDRVRNTGEPVIIEEQGEPFVAVVSINDLKELESIRRERAEAEFIRAAAQAARQVTGPEPTEDEIVEAVKRTREELYRERYGAA